MRFFARMFAAFSFGLIAIGAGASPSAPVSGVDYRTLDKPQSTDSGKKVEVTEFFWYACPHCHAFEPALNDWVRKQGDAILFKRVPIVFGETPSQQQRFVPQQKLYYTLEAMGLLEQLHLTVFKAIHVGRQPLDNDAAITDFVEKQGVDKKKFIDLYNSFGVQTKVRRAAQLQQAYQIDGVPIVAIGGRYLTSPSIVVVGMGRQSELALQSGALQVMSWLVEKTAGTQQAGAAISQPVGANK